MNKDTSAKSATSACNPGANLKRLNLDDYDAMKVSHEPNGKLPAHNQATDITGQWAMPATVILVLIICFSGLFLGEASFTPVIGLIAPVLMALIMVIRDASIGKEEQPAINGRKQKVKDIPLARTTQGQRIKTREISDQSRQFDMMQASTKEFFELIKEINTRMTQQMNKATPTEFAADNTKSINENSSKLQKQSAALAKSTEQ